ncbi:ABC transporter B family protein [Quillaja saponaria]|uniref:ABC transporter B family protein n=1 Tax=Quillaja saponaria TaxID=32244 RepID=A0AAD7PXD0_QUISA|nr:ABC transporter B family protein [Quillaja saponaria]
MALVVQTISAVVIACTMGLVIARRLAIVMIAVQPLIIVCFYTRRVLLKSMSSKAIKAQDESSKLAAEAVSNLRTVTIFSSQDRKLKMLEKAQDGARLESITQVMRDPNVTIFQGFSMEIEAGKSTALVEKSGSGKSTIIGLIERFYDPHKGSVIIDGKDIRSYQPRSMRKHIALVSQEPTLFAGTVRENIAYGTSDKIDETEIIKAAKAANAHNFISSLKDGYDTWCGDIGVQLSGGQKKTHSNSQSNTEKPKWAAAG